jgi:hypothetical protein
LNHDVWIPQKAYRHLRQRFRLKQKLHKFSASEPARERFVTSNVRRTPINIQFFRPRRNIRFDELLTGKDVAENESYSPQPKLGRRESGGGLSNIAYSMAKAGFPQQHANLCLGVAR